MGGKAAPEIDPETALEIALVPGPETGVAALKILSLLPKQRMVYALFYEISQVFAQVAAFDLSGELVFDELILIVRWSF